MNPIYEADYRNMIRRLIEVRKKSGLRQIDAAKLIGKEQSYISKVENCQKILNILELKQFLDAYNIKSNVIYDD
ncbi:MAG: helix-turn-helix transcriptional regulator [Coriobacteriia bacterium]|nr:helix-turn-helix transcriptional regulator [Coriobacteriia bacterium]